MELTKDQLRDYQEHGLLLLPGYFTYGETAALQSEIGGLLAQPSPGRLLERDGRTVRAVHGCHADNDLCARLVRLPRFVEPARQLLGTDVYVHQFKINIKAAFGGDVWKWHQDFIFWNKQDGVEDPHLVNFAVFCDDVNEFNGPLYFIRGSHRRGMVDRPAGGATIGSQDWESSFAADLKYTLDPSEITSMLDDGDLVAPKGPAGSVLMFHPNLAHASVPNISPWNRTLLIVTYNSVDNAPLRVPEPRPEFLVSRDATPLEPVAEDDLLREVGVAKNRP